MTKLNKQFKKDVCRLLYFSLYICVCFCISSVVLYLMTGELVTNYVFESDDVFTVFFMFMLVLVFGAFVLLVVLGFIAALIGFYERWTK